MPDRSYYHDGSRQLQDELDSCRLADRLVEGMLHRALKDARLEAVRETKHG